jgi:hypothetical protein
LVATVGLAASHGPDRDASCRCMPLPADSVLFSSRVGRRLYPLGSILRFRPLVERARSGSRSGVSLPRSGMLPGASPRGIEAGLQALGRPGRSGRRQRNTFLKRHGRLKSLPRSGLVQSPLIPVSNHRAGVSTNHSQLGLRILVHRGIQPARCWLLGRGRTYCPHARIVRQYRSRSQGQT